MLERGWKHGERRPARRRHEEAPAPITLSTPRSRCPSCGHAIAWYENIPVASWLWLRAPLLGVQDAASRRAIRWSSSPTARAVRARRLALRRAADRRCSGACFCAVLVALARHRLGHDAAARQPDPAAALGRHRRRRARLDDSRSPTRSGAPSPATSRSWSVYWLFKLTTGKEGMGFGDFKLLAALGAWLGWKMILPIVLGASVDRRRGRHRDEDVVPRCAKAATCRSARSSPAPRLVVAASPARSASSAGCAGLGLARRRAP